MMLTCMQVAPGKKPIELANASAFAKPSAPATKKVIVGRVVRNEDSCDDLGPADDGAEAHKANLRATEVLLPQIAWRVLHDFTLGVSGSPMLPMFIVA